MTMKTLLISALAAFGLVFTPVHAAAPAGLPDFTSIVEKEGRAVVNISTTSTIQDPSSQPGADDETLEFLRRFGFPVPQGQAQPRERQAQSLGSGFIIDASGYILTNAHVVANADEITVKLTDKRTFKARVIGSDGRTDVALLKIDATNLPKVDIGSVDKLKVGEWVLAIGSPFGLESTVTAGIVSAKGRNLPDENFVPFIQTDAAVNPGNSGGPLFNLAGEVVGINSQIFSRSGGYMGLSFAIPIDVAMKVADELKATGKVRRARLGVMIQEVNEELAKSFGLAKATGALLNQVEKDGPADKAGFKAGDIVTHFNGQEITNSGDLPRLVSAQQPGTQAKVTVWRNKAKKELTVVLGEMEQADPASAKREYRGKQRGEDNSRFGLTVEQIGARQLKQLGIRFGVGVVNATGPAAAAGLVRGDVIVGIGGDDLENLAQLNKALSALQVGETLPLRVLRSGQSQFLILKAPAAQKK